MNELTHRIMGNQSIASSFKGILRLSPIMDGKPPYDFLVESYYKNFNPAFKNDIEISTTSSSPLNIANGAYNDTTRALNGELKRYTSEDLFYNAKLPVTDSVGNYVNINMGTDGTVFGSIEDSKNNNDYHNGFPVLEANSVVIGLEKIKNNKDKNSKSGGKLNIVENPNTGKLPQIITECNISQSDVSDTNQTRYSQHFSGPYKTVISGDNNDVNEYDSLIYNQEWYEKDNENNVTSTVKIKNLQEIVKQRLEKFLQSSIIEMPSGSIIWQYINLKKWYATDDSGNEIEYSGARPKMANTGKNAPIDDRYPFYSSRIQGISKKINRLYTNTGGNNEIIPLYKRDYVLCDGTIYEIPAALNENVSNSVVETRDYVSYNRFKDLFSTIGYYYTKPENLKKHYCYRETTDGKREFWTTNETGYPKDKDIDGVFLVDNEIKNHEIMFGRDYCMLLAFYYLHKEMLNGTFASEHKTFDREKAENWLKDKKFDKEHLFTTIANEDEDQLYYIQPVVHEEVEEIKINLGTEVNSFKSELALNITNNGIEKCEVWQTPEVQYILDMFDNYKGDGATTNKYYPNKKTGDVIIMTEMASAMKKYCSCYFQVPNFNIIEEQKYKMGSFMCSSATMTFSNQDVFEQTKSNCCFSVNELPHRHHLFIGWNHYGTANPKCGKIPPILTSIYNSFDSRCSAYGIFKTNGDTPGLTCTDTSNNYVVQFNPNVVMRKINANLINNNSDVLDENSVYYCEMMFKGNTLNEPDRGITSNQVNECPFNIAKLERAKSANLIAGSAEFFAPESINMLPLIKL